MLQHRDTQTREMTFDELDDLAGGWGGLRPSPTVLARTLPRPPRPVRGIRPVFSRGRVSARSRMGWYGLETHPDPE